VIDAYWNARRSRPALSTGWPSSEYPDRAGVGERAELGELLAALAERDRPEEADGDRGLGRRTLVQ